MDTPDRPYKFAAGLIAAVAGAALFSLVFWATSEGGPMPIHWPEFLSPPVHLTVLFALPLGLFFMSAGRMKGPGLLLFILGMTAAHWLAMEEAIRIATANDHGDMGGVLGGAAGGAVGSVGTWILLMLMGADFRRPKAIAVMVVATLALAAIGAYGVGLGSPTALTAFLGGKPFEGPELDPPGLVVSLYLPWQILYGLFLVQLFRSHRAG